MPPISGALDEFKAALVRLDDQSMLDRFYYGRPAVMLPDGRDAELRRDVARHLGVAMRDVLITGSAKTGFTTVTKEHRPVFSHFGDSSDIDVAVISKDLFENYWYKTSQFSEEDSEWTSKKAFRAYLSRGWIRPELLPANDDFTEKVAWFDFFRTLTSSGKYGPYKIAAGVYHSEKFWEDYACRALGHCRHQIENAL